MEVVIFIILIVLLVILLNIQSNQRNSTDNLKKDISRVSRQLQDLKDQLADIDRKAVSASTTIEQQKEKEAAELKAQEERVTAIAEMNRRHEEQRKLLEQQLLEQPVKKVEAVENIIAEKKEQLPVAAKESWLDKWLRNNPDLEKFIGENLFNKIGIAVLVFGIGFFVKYAIEKNWI